MRSVVKNKRRRGATSMFLAIILSALILVECTYIGLVEDLRCNLAFDRAVKLQVDTYLAEYDRQLFKTYGIYAFRIDSVDDEVFRHVLSESGIENGDMLVVTGINTFDTNDLRRVVSVYYSYRATGVLLNFFSDYVASLIGQFDDIALSESLSSLTSSGASGVLIQILDSTLDISSHITELAEDFGIIDPDGNVVLLDNLIDKIDDMNSSPPDIGDGFDPTSISFISTITGGTIDAYEFGADFIENIVFHGYAVNYAAYNFDSFLDEETALDGTSFTAFHADNRFDVEYILTGIDGIGGAVASHALLYGLLFIKNFVTILADTARMEVIRGIGTVLSALITILTEGVINATPELCSLYIVAILSEFDSTSDLSTLTTGGEVAFLAIDGFEGFSLDYRQLMSGFINFLPDDVILTRMHDRLMLDLDGYVCGVEISNDHLGGTMVYSDSYELYEEVTYDAA